MDGKLIEILISTVGNLSLGAFVFWRVWHHCPRLHTKKSTETIPGSSVRAPRMEGLFFR